MLKFLQPYDFRPWSFIVDPSDEFTNGNIAQSKLFGNNTVVGLSDGRAPIGVIDDIRTKAFSAAITNEPHKIIVTDYINVSGTYYTTKDIFVPLDNPNIFKNSFFSTIPGILNERNGILTIPEGTVLNLMDGATPIGLSFFCSYRHFVSGVPGIDTTSASGHISVYCGTMMIGTDQFETNMQYPVGAPLYSNECGLFTTRKIEENYPPVGIVMAPPSSINSFLSLLWK